MGVLLIWAGIWGAQFEGGVRLEEEASLVNYVSNLDLDPSAMGRQSES